MNLYDGRSKLAYALEKLRLRWQAAESDWRDAVSREFEHEFLAPLEAQIGTTAQAIDRLQEVLSRAEQECR